jgi:hypothetical protein
MHTMMAGSVENELYEPRKFIDGLCVDKKLVDSVDLVVNNVKFRGKK